MSDKTQPRRFGDCQDTLRGIGLSRGGELSKVDALFGDGSLGNQVVDGRRARLILELRPDEHAGHFKRGAQELIHRPHAFGDEQVLPLSCFPPAQIASDR
jgi:hypothetical protein